MIGRDIVDRELLRSTRERFIARGIRLPKFAELADPASIAAETRASLIEVDPDAPSPLNLFRVHWYNASDRRSFVSVPEHVVLDEALTGVAAPIIVTFGDRFPMIRAHKVLAAYACLVPRLVTGAFDPERHRAIWPSTGNYCRGGVAISRILGCRGVAVLPEGMSRERFRWLEAWVRDSTDVVRTPGSESNVKEIYDACARLRADETNVVLNQFSEFGNHLAHVRCTGPALETVFASVQRERPELEAAAFVSATGSAGTIGAGDHLKERLGCRIVAAEALECPTLLKNGYGEHNIQGIGDKHVPFIHNVMNTDVVVAVSDRATDQLNVLFNSAAGRSWLRKDRGLDEATVDSLGGFGLSSLCNVVGAIKVARALGLSRNDAILTVATDGAAMYESEYEKVLARDFGGRFDERDATETAARHLFGANDENVLALTGFERDRIFNLGYFTWVEQQGVSLREFEARRDAGFWRDLREDLSRWDDWIDAFNSGSDPT